MPIIIKEIKTGKEYDADKPLLELWQQLAKEGEGKAEGIKLIRSIGLWKLIGFDSDSDIIFHTLNPAMYSVSDTDYIAKDKIFSALSSHYGITHLPNSRQHAINKVLLGIAKLLGIPLSQIE